MAARSTGRPPRGAVPPPARSRPSAGPSSPDGSTPTAPARTIDFRETATFVTEHFQINDVDMVKDVFESWVHLNKMRRAIPQARRPLDCSAVQTTITGQLEPHLAEFVRAVAANTLCLRIEDVFAHCLLWEQTFNNKQLCLVGRDGALAMRPDPTSSLLPALRRAMPERPTSGDEIATMLERQIAKTFPEGMWTVIFGRNLHSIVRGVVDRRTAVRGNSARNTSLNLYNALAEAATFVQVEPDLILANSRSNNRVRFILQTCSNRLNSQETMLDYMTAATILLPSTLLAVDSLLLNWSKNHHHFVQVRRFVNDVLEGAFEDSRYLLKTYGRSSKDMATMHQGHRNELLQDKIEAQRANDLFDRTTTDARPAAPAPALPGVIPATRRRALPRSRLQMPAPESAAAAVPLGASARHHAREERSQPALSTKGATSSSSHQPTTTPQGARRVTAHDGEAPTIAADNGSSTAPSFGAHRAKGADAASSGESDEAASMSDSSSSDTQSEAGGSTPYCTARRVRKKAKSGDGAQRLGTANSSEATQDGVTAQAADGAMGSQLGGAAAPIAIDCDDDDATASKRVDSSPATLPGRGSIRRSASSPATPFGNPQVGDKRPRSVDHLNASLDNLSVAENREPNSQSLIEQEQAREIERLKRTIKERSTTNAKLELQLDELKTELESTRGDLSNAEERCKHANKRCELVQAEMRDKDANWGNEVERLKGELEQARENHKHEIEAVQDRAERDLKALKDVHENQLKALKGKAAESEQSLRNKIAAAMAALGHQGE